MTRPGGDLESKQQLRRQLLAARRRVPASVRFAEAMALTAQLTRGRIVRPGQTVCLYVPTGSEPGTVQMLDEVAGLGVRVLLPVVAGSGPLDWAWYAGMDFMRRGAFGLLEPDGERLGAAALRIADLVFVPALAVDRQGVRLGRGAGYYDRSLPLAVTGTAFVGVVREHELLNRLPAEPHDVRMSAVLTPNRGLLAVR